MLEPAQPPAVPEPCCLHCGHSGTPLVVLARVGALEAVCRTCFLLAESTSWLRDPRLSPATRALASDVLEQLYIILRANHD